MGIKLFIGWGFILWITQFRFFYVSMLFDLELLFGVTLTFWDGNLVEPISLLNENFLFRNINGKIIYKHCKKIILSFLDVITMIKLKENRFANIKNATRINVKISSTIRFGYLFNAILIYFALDLNIRIFYNQISINPLTTVVHLTHRPRSPFPILAYFYKGYKFFLSVSACRMGT